MGYSNSFLMTDILTYKDNDITHGIVNTKQCTRSVSRGPSDFDEAR